MSPDRFPTARLEHGHEKGNWFIENPSLQPKTEIADYVAQEEIPGLRVPARYTLAEAIDVCKERRVYFRTEHPDEYAGASGVGESVVYGPDANLTSVEDLLGRLHAINEKDVKSHYTKPKDFDQRMEAVRKKREGIVTPEDPEVLEAYAKLSYSAWEYIPGTNKTIYRDDVVHDRFHIFCRWKDSENRQQASYMQIEGRMMVHSSGDDASHLEASNVSLADLYEEVNRLERFDSSHSAIMEFQESDETPGQHYFLQTHIGRNHSENNFVITEIPQGYVEIANVRGATPPEGLTTDMTLLNMMGDRTNAPSRLAVNYLSSNENPRDMEVIISKTPLSQIANHHKFSHFNVDILTKPKVTLFPDEALGFRDELYTTAAENAVYQYETDYFNTDKRQARLEEAYIRIHVVADGTKAYISKPTSFFARLYDKRNRKEIILEVQPDGTYEEVTE